MKMNGAEQLHGDQNSSESFIDLLLSLFGYLPSSRLVLDVVSGSDLRAHVLQVWCRSIDGSGGSGSTGCCCLLLQRGLLGHGGFGDDPAAMSGCGFTISGGGGSGRGGG